MNILLFVVILALLILVHEFGHFITAKYFGIRVDEFSIGFPPRLFSKKFGETMYSLNLIPFGGYVKIFGETPDRESISGVDSERSFINKPKHIQAAVLFAGVFFNLILAWFLISAGFIIGLPTPVSVAQEGRTLEDISLVITEVIADSPAEDAGLLVGDKILALSVGDSSVSNPTPKEMQDIIISSAQSGSGEIDLTFKRGKNSEESISLVAEDGIFDNPAIGIAMDEIGILKLPLHLALWEGGKLTYDLTLATFFGLMSFFADVFVGNADFSSISGPVGIVGIVGSASEFGFIYLLSLVALISINLAIINLIPFPALDGGRLFFLLIEKIKGSPIKPVVANTVNMIGFALLLLFMIIVTYNDIAKLITG